MKKLVVSLILGASLAIVPSAFALKAMTADNMKDTTGQAGVSISVSNVAILTSANTCSYIDSDVTFAYNVANSESLMVLNAIDPTTYPITATVTGWTAPAAPTPLTIDLMDYGPYSAIAIGLPTLAIQKSAKTQTFSLGTEELGAIAKTETTTTLLGGTVYIFAH